MIPLHATPSSGWVFGPISTVTVVWLVAVGVIYLAAWRRTDRSRTGPKRVSALLLGLAALGLAIIGPLDHAADRSFAAHMVQHLVLIQVAAPLILMGRPVQVILAAAPRHGTRRALQAVAVPRAGRWTLATIGHPAVILVLLTGVVAFWHLPGPYQAAVVSEPIHWLEHASFFLAGLLFWRLFISPVPRHHKLGPHAAFGLLFATCMALGLVAGAITVTPDILYPVYLDDFPSVEAALRDQRIGGGVMWLSGGIYFALIFALLFKSQRSADDSSAPGIAATDC